MTSLTHQQRNNYQTEENRNNRVLFEHGVYAHAPTLSKAAIPVNFKVT